MISKRFLLPLVPVCCGLALWQVAAWTGLMNGRLFPPPLDILSELATVLLPNEAGDSILLKHLAVTLERLALATAIGSAAGIVMGVLMGLVRSAHKALDGILTFFMPIPGIAMAPLFIVWMGFGSPAIVSVAAIAAFFPVVHNTAAGIRSMDKTLVKSAKIVGAGKISILLQVYLPWSALFIFNGFKLGLARCWRTVVAVEFIAAANWGLGYMIWDAAEYLRSGVVYGGIIILAATYVCIEFILISPLERITVERWGMLKR